MFFLNGVKLNLKLNLNLNLNSHARIIHQVWNNCTYPTCDIPCMIRCLNTDVDIYMKNYKEFRPNPEPSINSADIQTQPIHQEVFITAMEVPLVRELNFSR